MIGYTERVPRSFGDNEGVWPIRFVLTREPRKAAGQDDRASPWHRVTVHEFAYVVGHGRGKALIQALDSLLLGVGRQNRLRRSWRDVDDPAVVWAVLLPEALETLRIDVHDEMEKQAEIRRRHRRQVRAFQGNYIL